MKIEQTTGLPKIIGVIWELQTIDAILSTISKMLKII